MLVELNRADRITCRPIATFAAIAQGLSAPILQAHVNSALNELLATAQGVMMGTRLVTSVEFPAHTAYKQSLEFTQAKSTCASHVNAGM